MIDKEQWSMMGAYVKGKIYESLLKKMQNTPKVVQVKILHQVL